MSTALCNHLVHLHHSAQPDAPASLPAFHPTTACPTCPLAHTHLSLTNPTWPFANARRSLFEEVQPELDRAAGDGPAEVRSAAIEMLALTCYVLSEDDDITHSVMDRLQQLWTKGETKVDGEGSLGCLEAANAAMRKAGVEHTVTHSVMHSLQQLKPGAGSCCSVWEQPTRHCVEWGGLERRGRGGTVLLWADIHSPLSTPRCSPTHSRGRPLRCWISRLNAATYIAAERDTQHALTPMCSPSLPAGEAGPRAAALRGWTLLFTSLSSVLSTPEVEGALQQMATLIADKSVDVRSAAGGVVAALCGAYKFLQPGAGGGGGGYDYDLDCDDDEVGVERRGKCLVGLAGMIYITSMLMMRWVLVWAQVPGAAAVAVATGW